MDNSMSNLAQAQWFPQTKFSAPYVGADILVRPNLLRQLQHSIAAHRLSLISAPAGSGKTTLLAVWQSQPDNPFDVAWLRLDEDDNDPATFLTALTLCLRRLDPAFGTNLDGLLATLTDPDQQMRRIMGALINNVVESLPAPFVLALDDLHTLTEPTIYQALDYLLDHLPEQMSVVVTTRYEPRLSVSRLRARGQLAELNLETLRFTPDEVRTLLNEQLGLQLSDDDLERLQTHTEGWVTGLRLLALSLDRLSGPTERSAFINHLAHRDRYVFDFLADEVLNVQRPEVRQFLLETSILAELTPELCKAVTDRQDAPHLLDDVYRRNLFLTATAPHRDGTGDKSAFAPTFHYHDLFADFLGQRLRLEYPPEAIQTLHRRAAEAQPVSELAISHYLAAELWLPAAQCIAEIGDSRIDRGLVESVQGWIMALPPEVRDTQPWPVYLLGRIAWQRGDFPRAESLLAQALAEFERQNDVTGTNHALVHLAGTLIGQYDFERAYPFLERALSRSIPLLDRLRLLPARAYMLLYQGDWQGVRRDILDSIRLAEESGLVEAYHNLTPSLGSFLVHLPGSIDALEHFSRQALVRMGDAPGPALAASLNLLGYICLQRGKLAESEELAGRAREMIEKLGDIDPWIGMDQDVLLTCHALVRGDSQTAIAHWQAQMDQYAQSPSTQPSLPLARYLLARSHLQAGEMNEVRRLAAQAGDAPGEDALPESALAHLFLCTLQAIADRQYPAAEKLLQEATALQGEMPHTRFVGSAALWLAYLYEEWGRPEEAIALSETLLAECQQAGTPGLILREGPLFAPILERMSTRKRKSALVSLLLDALAEADKPRAMAVPGSVESLSPREVEVLRLLASGASNQEIALQLVFTVSTAKAHVSKILAKLDVSSRSAAVARARELHLI